MTAMHYIKIAQQFMMQWWISLPDPDLSYLVEGTPEFDDYIRDLRWSQTFALLNREEMTDRLAEAVSDFMGEPVVEHQRINCHHNFTESAKCISSNGCGCHARVRSARRSMSGD